MTTMSTGTSKPVDRYIPWFFVLFFAIVFILDGIFVYLAVNTHTGTVTDKAYEKGLAYDQVLEASQAQRDSGVQIKAGYKDGLLNVSLIDRAGQAMEGAEVKAHMIRAVQAGHDFTVTLTPVGNGVYSAAIDAPLPGAWTAKIEATWRSQTFRTTVKLVTE